MKREVFWITSIVILFSLGYVSATPPSFEVFTGHVFCTGDSTPLSGYSITADASNGTNTLNYVGSISNDAYSFIIDADSSYNVSFDVDGGFAHEEQYQPYGFIEQNFTLSSSHVACVSAPPANNDGGGGGGGGGIPPTNTTTTIPDCGNGIINAGEQCDGVNLNFKTCKILGYSSGSLSCKSDCTFDETSCVLGEELNVFDNIRLPIAQPKLLFWVIISLAVTVLAVFGFLIYRKNKKKKGINQISKQKNTGFRLR